MPYHREDLLTLNRRSRVEAIVPADDDMLQLTKNDNVFTFAICSLTESSFGDDNSVASGATDDISKRSAEFSISRHVFNFFCRTPLVSCSRYC